MASPTIATPSRQVTNIGRAPGVTVVGFNAHFGIQPPITANSAYSANNVVGGIMQLQNGASQANGSVRLENLIIVDRANQKAGGVLYFFSTQPGLGIGQWNDKANVTAGDDDLLIEAAIPVSASDFGTISGTTRAVADVPLFGTRLLHGDTLANLWCAFVTNGTPTYNTVGDLIFKFRISYAD